MKPPSRRMTKHQCRPWLSTLCGTLISHFWGNPQKIALRKWAFVNGSTEFYTYCSPTIWILHCDPLLAAFTRPKHLGYPLVECTNSLCRPHVDGKFNLYLLLEGEPMFDPPQHHWHFLHCPGKTLFGPHCITDFHFLYCFEKILQFFHWLFHLWP